MRENILKHTITSVDCKLENSKGILKIDKIKIKIEWEQMSLIKWKEYFKE